MRKVITRVKGGLGNQLFCYAAARRLALVNDAQLVVDDTSGFVRDRQFRRRYALSNFSIAARRATAAERMEPFDRYRRALACWREKNRPFRNRRYLMQEGVDFDRRLLEIKVSGTLYLDGLWQSEGYFKDVEEVVRRDLEIVPPADHDNQQMAARISSAQSVALHVRWFNQPNGAQSHNASMDYYASAISLLETQIRSPRYFIFSDDPEAARRKLDLPAERAVLVNHNRGDDMAHADLWLMSQCKHFIIANSTFSWWGAWLALHRDKVVIAPEMQRDELAAWGFEGLIPAGWLKV